MEALVTDFACEGKRGCWLRPFHRRAKGGGSISGKNLRRVYLANLDHYSEYARMIERRIASELV
jgi:hypothetical protein